MALDGPQHELADGARRSAVVGQLLVVLDGGGLGAGAVAAVGPGGAHEGLAGLADFVGGEEVGDLEEHG